MSLFRRNSGPITDSANFYDTGGGGLLLFNAGPMASNMPPTPFERGLTRDDPANIGRNDRFEIPPSEDMRPREDVDSEDSIFRILFDTIIGEQGIPEGVSAEAIEALRGDFGPTTAPEELQEIAIDIAEAGGFDEWLAQQPQGDPEDLFEPDTGLEPDTDFSAPRQEGINLEDFQAQFPDLNVRDYEDGMYTDPGTGTVYVINIPPGGIPEEAEGEGEGGAGNGTEGNGEGGQDGEGQQSQGQEGQTGQTNQTGETREIPDYSGIGNEDYGYPGGLPGGGRGGTIYDVPVQDDPGFRIIAGVPFIGTGSGGEGGSGGGGGGGMLSRPTYNFRPITASIGYQPVAVPRAILPEYAPITNGLFSGYFA